MKVTFEVGDKVEWDYDQLGKEFVEDRAGRYFIQPPFTVAEVHPIERRNRTVAGHHQHLTIAELKGARVQLGTGLSVINDDGVFSGAWFKPCLG